MKSCNSQSGCHTSLSTPAYRGWRTWLTSRTFLLLAALAIAGIGLSFGGWGFLVAAGLAPVILSILPCVVMCGLGLCMMGMNKKSASNTSLSVNQGNPQQSEFPISSMMTKSSPLLRRNYTPDGDVLGDSSNNSGSISDIAPVSR